MVVAHRRIDKSRMRAGMGRRVRVGIQRRAPIGTIRTTQRSSSEALGAWQLRSSVKLSRRDQIVVNMRVGPWM